MFWRRDFREKRVLITGGAAGIGLSTAEAFAREGAELLVTDIDAGRLEDATRRIEGLGARVRTWRVDVTDPEAVESLAREVHGSLGPLDVLINNAGVGYHGELADTSLDTWKRLLDVNLWGVLHHVHAFLPPMLERRQGHIVNVSSGQAFFRLPTWGAYASVKACVGAYSETLHFELRPRGVHVTTVYPFMVNTGFYDGIEAKSFGARMSMKLLPYYSQQPETVGRIILRAVRRRKRVEMVSVINDMGYYMHLMPPVASAVSALSHRALAGRA